MTRFTDRVERDLTQISDQASPSSTAWEAIRHRIDEQDTEPTMEVIMLDPDTNKLNKRPRTGLLVAASVAAVALIGGLIVVANRDDAAPPADEPIPTVTVPVTDPAIAGDPEPVDEETAPVVVDPEPVPSTDAAVDSAQEGDDDAATASETEADAASEPEVEAVPAAEPITQGVFVPSCENGEVFSDPDSGRLILESICEHGGGEAQPFDANQVLTVSVLQDVVAPATPFISISDNGFMNAGLNWGGFTQGSYVGVFDGVDDYAGEPVFVSDFSTQNTDGSNRVSDGRWWTDIGPRPAPTDESGEVAEVVAEVNFVCEIVEPATDGSPAVSDCTYSGEGVERFMPLSERTLTQTIPADFAVTEEGQTSVSESDFVVIQSEDGRLIRAGITTAGTHVRTTGFRIGTGEFEGSVIQEWGWGELTDPGNEASPIEGIIQIVVLPIDF